MITRQKPLPSEGNKLKRNITSYWIIYLHIATSLLRHKRRQLVYCSHRTACGAFFDTVYFIMSSVKSCYLGQIPLAVPKEILPGPCRARSFKYTGLHALQQKRERTIKISASAEDRGGGMDDLDVAVFRFTLGIPGFDDALIPRVVGVVGALLLVLNHFLSDSSPTDAQVRSNAAL